MDKFTIIDILVKLLKKADYQNKEAFSQNSFDDTLVVLEKDREEVFKSVYGNKLIKSRGTQKIKESMYRLLEAEKDVKAGYITMTMHYLLTQIKIGQLQFRG